MVRLGLAIVVTAAALAGPACAEFSADDRKAIATSGLPRTSVAAVKSGMVVAIRNRGSISTAGAVIEGITLQGEVVSSDAAQALGYRSMRSTVNVDCVRRRDLVVKMTVYSERGGKGAAVVRQVPGDWAQPSPDTYLAAVIRNVCGAAPPQMAAAPPLLPVKDAAAISVDRPDRRAASRTLPASLPAEPPLAFLTPEVVGPDQPMSTAVEARRRTAMAQLASAAPELRPAIQPMPAPRPTPSPAKPVAAKPAPAAPVPAKPSNAKPAPGKVAVQIAASSSEALAREALAKVKPRLRPPLSTQVKLVQVDGKTYHRALVTGFASRSEAQAFCGSLKSECFVR